jgi:hypothetical protein
MFTYDLCLAWNWQNDADFVLMLEKACNLQGVSFLQVTPKNIEMILKMLGDQQVSIRVLLDRATDTDPLFLPLIHWAEKHECYCIDPIQKSKHANDKASMHLDFITAGLQTPYTIILPSYQDQPDPSTIDLQVLGEKFAVKPAHGSGGEGVVLEAKSLDQVLAIRQKFPADRYLLQARIVPRQIDLRPAWFRVIHCFGEVYPCWWNPDSHIYTPVTAMEEQRYGLDALRGVTKTITSIAGLDIFSTEIAFTEEDLFVIVDYVNDQIDLRLQSKENSGVPDDIVKSIASNIVGFAAGYGR